MSGTAVSTDSAPAAIGPNSQAIVLPRGILISIEAIALVSPDGAAD